ncbi:MULTISPECIES: GNAT family N-acetyltransferase [Pseudomonadota]|uniref:GNAT family N-acetyltransferase n=1 Tax=Pseudomonadota TaxID=1224 RepID=UPI00272F3A51|nr:MULTISPECIES: GNAT family N-acetyltransferase [Pseudomonadota]MDP1788246.1 GNAT family N-acetyltransferase [Nitrosomonas sp.]MDP2214315.1 GNAT family N-acetyltransferase [Phenylobacterium sp.]
MSPIKTINIRIFNSFSDVETIWRSFEKTSDNYAFQNFDWLKHWHETIGITTKPCLVVVEYPAGKPVMILPLGLEKRYSVDCLVWLGGIVSDYLGPLLCTDFSQNFPFDFSQTVWPLITVRLPAYDAILFEKMPKLINGQTNPLVSLPCIPTPNNAYATHLDKSLDSFLKEKRSSKSIATEKRKHRRLREYGQIEFVLAQHSEQIHRFLGDMMTQKSRSYKEMGVANLFDDSQICTFFRNLSVDFCSNGFVHLSALTLDGRTIATLWGLVYKKRFYHLYPTYEKSELIKYAPGGLLMWHMFEWCMNNGVEIYDFTIGDESYKDQWSDQELFLYDCYQGRTILGVGYTGLFKMTGLLKYKIKHTPKLWKLAQEFRALLGNYRQR